MVESFHCVNGMNRRSDAGVMMEQRGHVIDYCGEVITAEASVHGEKLLAPENVTKNATERSRLSEIGTSSVGYAAVMKEAVRLAAHRTTRRGFEYVCEQDECKR